MKTIIKQILLFIAIVFGGNAFIASAQSLCDSSSVHSFRISYPINDTELHENYQNNAESLKMIRDHFQKSPRIDSIIIYSYASPEGPYKLNKRLAEERGQRARRYLIEQIPAERNFPDSLIIIKPTAENWDGLHDMVSQSYPYSDKQEILDILAKTNVTPDQKKILLRKHNGGMAWKYIKAEILPQLRYATWIAEWVYVRPIVDSIDVIQNKIPQLRAIPPTYTLDIKPSTIRYAGTGKGIKTILALKSNLVYDLASFTNFSIEAPLYKNKLSLLYYHQFPWWTWGQAKNEYCSRFLSIGGEARWWVKSTNRFNGHFLGAYGESGKYDFEYQRNICYQGEFWSTGLSYGYAMPIGRHLNLEFSISAGYASIAYRGYTPSEDYEILWRDPNKVGRLQYFGPTKAQVSLVIPIRVKTKGGKAYE